MAKTAAHLLQSRPLRRLAVGLVLAGVAGFSPAHAVNINFNFTTAAGDLPSQDADGSGLEAQFRAAGDAWERIFRDSHTLTLEVPIRFRLGRR